MNSLPVFIILAAIIVLLIVFWAIKVSHNESEKEPDTPQTHEFDRDGLHFTWSPYSVSVTDRNGNIVFKMYTNQFKTDDDVYDAYKELAEACQDVSKNKKDT